jgi:hypothetical protein
MAIAISGRKSSEGREVRARLDESEVSQSQFDRQFHPKPN